MTDEARTGRAEAESSLLRQKIMDRMREGRSLRDIASAAEVSVPTVRNCLKHPEKVLSDRNLRKLAPVLRLTDEERVIIAGDLRKGRERSQEGSWSAAEEQVIIDHPDWSLTEIARKIGRTVSGVKNHRFRMRQQGRLPADGAALLDLSPRAEDFLMLEDLVNAAREALAVSLPRLSVMCGLGRGTLSWRMKHAGAPLSAPIRSKLSKAFNVSEVVLEELAQTDMPPCGKCGQRHRGGVPRWVPEAIDIYTRYKVSCARVAQMICKHPDLVHWWLSHEGVIRSQAEARRMAIRRFAPPYKGAPLAPPPQPQPCQCGCGQTTSGIQRRNKDGVWEPAKYVQGHYRWAGQFRSSKVNRSGFRSRLFQEDVLRRLRDLDWGCTRFGREIGTSPANVLYRDRVRIEYVVVAALVLDLDVQRSLERAGWPGVEIRTLFQWRLIECLGRMRYNHTAIAELAGISYKLIGLYLQNPEMIPTDETLAKLAPILPLTPDEVAIIRAQRRPKPPHTPESRRRGIETLRAKDPSHFRRTGQMGGRAAWADREKALEQARRVGLSRRCPIRRASLVPLLRAGKTYKEIGTILGANWSTVRKYVRQYGLRTARAARQARRRRDERIREHNDAARLRTDSRIAAVVQQLKLDGVPVKQRAIEKQAFQMYEDEAPTGQAIRGWRRRNGY